MPTVKKFDANTITPEEVVRQLRALREQIPDFALLSIDAAKPLARAASVSVELVHESINAIDASAELRGSIGDETATLRAETELIGRWSQVIVEIDALRDGVVGGIKVRRFRVGGTALRVYQMSRQLTRYGDHTELLPHIQAMKAAAKFPKRRRAKPEPKPGLPVTKQ